jgi:hypothetical protein
MYDPACEELALHFLPPTWFPARDRFAAELAQQIQDAIEAWLEDKVVELERLAARPQTEH